MNFSKSPDFPRPAERKRADASRRPPAERTPRKKLPLEFRNRTENPPRNKPEKKSETI